MIEDSEEKILADWNNLEGNKNNPVAKIDDLYRELKFYSKDHGKQLLMPIDEDTVLNREGHKSSSNTLIHFMLRIRELRKAKRAKET